MGRRYLEGLPLGSTTWTHRLSSTVSVGTTLTPLLVLPITVTGVYIFRACIHVVHTATTGFTVTPGYTGQHNEVGYSATRFTASAVAVALHSSFGASASTVWIKGLVEGAFRANSEGNLTIGCTRAGGTSSIVQVGSFLEAYEVES